MQRTMPKDDVAVIGGDVAVHLAVARPLGEWDSAPSGVHSITALINPRTMFGDRSSGQQTRSSAFGGVPSGV